MSQLEVASFSFFLLCSECTDLSVYIFLTIYNGGTDGRNVGNTQIFKVGTSALSVKLSHDSIGKYQTRMLIGKRQYISNWTGKFCARSHNFTRIENSALHIPTW